MLGRSDGSAVSNNLGSAEYDSRKMFIFNLLYCQGDENDKLQTLYELLIEDHKKPPSELRPFDDQILKKIEYLIMIPTLLIANIIE